MNILKLKTPYLIFLGSEENKLNAKTGAGLVEWRPELCKAQFNLTESGLDLGLPRMSIAQAKEAGIKSLIIGTASIGGGLQDEWMDALVEAAQAGIDIVAGLHNPLNGNAALKAASEKTSSSLIDVRTPPENLPVGTGIKRTGKRILMAGTDCVSGKKFTALSMERDMKKRGLNADFRASGQTGIMIAGSGIPIDAVVSDFIAGAAEQLSPDNADDHWDVIEGQGSIFHPGYAAVSMGLLIGSQPDAFVVCHHASRSHMDGWESYILPTIEQVIERTTDIGSLTNPNIKCVGISVNTSGMSEQQREDYCADVSKKLGLPCIDPHVHGTDKIIDTLVA
ncbi:MAG: DUF1611 domain-containing protein [Kordiimonadaceae bacterium]|nr:DUF1611 domain-containing protein [Kordiimonadaceae bacterium]MBT7582734.1 DUF1611 domain-containing protein [Kordiimonadaceae bacterium]